MLDLKYMRANSDIVRTAITNKNEKADLDELLVLDGKLRSLLVEAEELKKERNVESERVAELKRKGENADEIITRMREVSEKIKGLDEEISGVQAGLRELMLTVPNIPHESVPVGKSEDDNVELRSWVEPWSVCDNPVPHWEIGEALGILDLKRGTKIAGSGFPVFIGAGARLVRALIQFMLDVHTGAHGYVEVAPPFVANRDSMLGTGQLPKLEFDMYRLEADDFFLIPTGEVPITNLYRDEILDGARLPIYHTAYTPCFRREAGSYGKDTRGLLRLHRFDKVEMVKFVEPETSYDELESLTANAQLIFERLDLPYGDLSFAAAKCYDIDVWSAGVGKWLEVSSCSNFEDFQARRAGIKYRPVGGGKVRYVHTLNGSGVALARTIVAILENYQTPGGAVRIPEVLKDYMGGLEEIAGV